MNEPTWGISGTTFLWLCAAAFVVTACGVWLRRKSLLNAQDGHVPSEAPDVYELALLNGGPRLAITIATAKLHRHRALLAGPRTKSRAAGRPKSGVEEITDLDHEVYDAVDRSPGTTVGKLERDLAGRPALTALPPKLARAGLGGGDGTRAG